ncbi:MAG: transposase [Thermoleophilia bacterium]
MGCYAQLTQEQRYQIHGLMKAGFNQSEMALEAGVHKSTVSREIGCNSGLRGYRPAQAHRLASERREAAVTKRISAEDWEMISRLIRFDLSPEQAAATVYQERGLRISPEWIYRFIYADKARGGDLHKHLRGQKPYRKRYGGGQDHHDH